MKRKLTSFDPSYFEKKKKAGVHFTMNDTFRHIYETNHWNNGESISGDGSSRSQTRTIENILPHFIKTLHIHSLLDVPCGDFNWMKNIDLGNVSYTGGDIVPEIVDRNRERYGSPQRNFITIDITSGPLPKTDLLLCRDCLVHFSYSDIRKALHNITSWDIKYLLTTTFPFQKINKDIITGDWRPLNLQLPPFNFPDPQYSINEECTESDRSFTDKTLALWPIGKLPVLI